MTNTIELTRNYIKSLFPRRHHDSHKYTYGSVLNIAGSANYRGAAFLSSIAPLKVGAGYVTLAGIDKVLSAVAVLAPEVVLFPLKSAHTCIEYDEHKHVLEILPKHTVLTIGCGIGARENNAKNAEDFFINLINSIKDIDIPVVIDADGLNFLARNKGIILPKHTIITPHAGELSRLININTEIIQKNRLEYAKQAAELFHSTVILKGHKTIITDANQAFINPTGNSALAKAGTGDILTGMIGGLLAQGLKPIDAACCAVYLHGKMAEHASISYSEYSATASELINYISEAIKELITENIN